MEEIEEIKTYYNAIYRSYNKLYGGEQKEKIKKIYKIYKKLFSDKKFERGLDFGCGTGISTFLLKKIAKEIYLYDISEKMIEKALKLHKDAIRIYKIENYKDYFDIIISITVLQDISNPYNELKLLKNLLKDNGLLIVSVLNKRGYNYWNDLFRQNFNIIFSEDIGKDFVFFIKKHYML